VRQCGRMHVIDPFRRSLHTVIHPSAVLLLWSAYPWWPASPRLSAAAGRSS